MAKHANPSNPINTAYAGEATIQLPPPDTKTGKLP